MFRTVFDAGGAVSVFPRGVDLPGVRRRVVHLHMRTLLGADSIIVEVATGLKKKIEINHNRVAGFV